MKSFKISIKKVFLRCRIFFLYIILIFAIIKLLSLNTAFSHQDHVYPTFLFLLPNTFYWQRIECACSRPKLPPLKSASEASLCSPYATRRGGQQKVISISLFGPLENEKFQMNKTWNYLTELINDMNSVYPDDFILRIYHDDTINMKDICRFECQNNNVDFCDVTEKSFIPPKIWRFIPAGDPLVDVFLSRDLDAALTARERAAVDAWLKSKKQFHVMRDHPDHRLRMLGGMWGFRPSLNRSASAVIHSKIHDQRIVRYYQCKRDQPFLFDYVWPMVQKSGLIHDSYICEVEFGHPTVPFPTQRINSSNCFIGGGRPCCNPKSISLPTCPMKCRPRNHPDWIHC